MDERSVDEQYLIWLYSQIASTRGHDPKRTYWNLFREMFQKEFIWFIPNDDNRVEDGRYLRHQFLQTVDVGEIDPSWMGMGCSFLEMLIALSARCSFQDERSPRVWFFELLDNLDLGHHTDNKHWGDEVDEVMDRVIFRTYLPDGRGGLFPLREVAQHDQREIEIWSQMSAYVIERM